MDETAPAPLSREGGAAMHCGKLDFMSVIEQNEDDGAFELMCIITDYMFPAAWKGQTRTLCSVFDVKTESDEENTEISCEWIWIYTSWKD